MRRESTVGGVQVADLLTALAGLGVASTALYRAGGLKPSTLRDPSARIPAGVVVALLAEAQRRTRDPLIGLRAGARAEPRGPLAYLLMSSPRLADGIRHTARFAQLMIDTLRIEVELSGDTASIVYDLRDATLADQRHVVDYMLMATLRAMSRAVGRALQLREIHVRHADPGYADDAERAFGCPIRYARRRIRMVFPASELRAKARLANPLIAEQIERFASALLSRMDAPTTLNERVADVLRAALAGGVRADRTTVARRLGMSDRTLQRGLTSEQTTFRSVRDGVLWGTVEALLSNPALKVEAVALSAGFGEVAAFCRAFKRWTGSSPTQYRGRLKQPRSTARTGHRQPGTRAARRLRP